jgi:hypothetical protein
LASRFRLPSFSSATMMLAMNLPPRQKQNMSRFQPLPFIGSRKQV